MFAHTLAINFMPEMVMLANHMHSNGVPKKSGPQPNTNMFGVCVRKHGKIGVFVFASCLHPHVRANMFVFAVFVAFGMFAELFVFGTFGGTNILVVGTKVAKSG